MTNTEINETVARKLGWRWNDKHDPLCLWIMPNGKCPAGGDVPNYAGSIQAAWEIVDYLIDSPNYQWKLSYQTILNPLNPYTFGILHRLDQVAAESADTAPLAICKAFLKLK